MSQAIQFAPEFFAPESASGATSDAAGRREVLIFGGSQGAHAINVAMVEAAPRLAAAGGVDDHASNRRARSGAGPRRLPATPASRRGWNRSSTPWTGR